MKFVIPNDVDIVFDNNKYTLHSNFWNSKVEISDPQYFTELNSLVEFGTTETSSDLCNFLIAQGILAKEDYAPEYVSTMAETLRKVLKITLMPTEDCNFRCPYCYEDHVPDTMSKELINTIKNYIEQHVHEHEIIAVNWFGGEPTLCKDAIIDVNQFILNLKRKNDFRFVCNMTTNGYLLDKETFVAFYNVGVTDYQITIDAWNHDTTRPHMSGEKTLEKILNNLLEISNLPKCTYKFKIIIRNNVLKGQNDFSWYDHLKKLFDEDDRFEILVKPVSNFGGDEVLNLNILKAEDKDLFIKEHIDYLTQIGMKVHNIIGQEFAECVCYSAYENGFIFRPNGNIEKCSVALGHPKNIVGKVLDGEVIIDQEKNAVWHTFSLKPGCKTCSYIASCMNKICPKNSVIDGFSSRCLARTEGRI